MQWQGRTGGTQVAAACGIFRGSVGCDVLSCVLNVSGGSTQHLTASFAFET